MKLLRVLLSCLLLLHEAVQEIKVVPNSGGINIECGDKKKLMYNDKDVTLPIAKRDESSGEYTCQHDSEADTFEKIYVKFRSCDNCVELDVASISGLAIGNVVATVVIGIAVYLVASHAHLDANAGKRKSSDRQHLVPENSHSRTPNEHYQGLKFGRNGQRDEYDVLQQNRR